MIIILIAVHKPITGHHTLHKGTQISKSLFLPTQTTDKINNRIVSSTATAARSAQRISYTTAPRQPKRLTRNRRADISRKLHILHARQVGLLPRIP